MLVVISYVIRYQNSTFTWYLTLKIRNILFYLRPAGLISKGPWQIPKTQGQASHKYDDYNIFLFIITSIFLCDFVHTGIVIFSDSVEGKMIEGYFGRKNSRRLPADCSLTLHC